MGSAKSTSSFILIGQLITGNSLLTTKYLLASKSGLINMAEQVGMEMEAAWRELERVS